jgi:hypothetical protein
MSAEETMVNRPFDTPPQRLCPVASVMNCPRDFVPTVDDGRRLD